MSRSSSEMEIKEAERTVIAKPVASRPTSSSFRSFSELLAGAIDPISPSNTGNETAVTAIRPKTVRFKPTANCGPPPPALVVASPGETAKEVLKSDSKPTVLYKPRAKVVSKSTVSLLANMGNFNVAHQQVLAPPENRIRNQTTEKTTLRSQFSSNPPHRPVPTPAEPKQATIEPSKAVAAEEDPKTFTSTASVDRPSYDGYNWRKYGQKQVKGSEYPRSYYKCTHPNCPVKKKVERSFDGQIAEIVYKGEHNHPKPQPPKRSSSGTHQEAVGSSAQDARKPTDAVEERNEGSDTRAEINSQANEKGIMVQPASHPGKGAAASNNAGTGTPDNSCGLSEDGEDGSKVMEADDDDEPRLTKKRKISDIPPTEASNTSADGTQDSSCVVVQNATAEPEMVGDGFRWRKYGQKVVKGNPYPRSYYRCTSLKCNVRKHVERVSDDPRAFITTYEGRHNHEMPLKSSSTAAPDENAQAGGSKDNP